MQQGFFKGLLVGCLASVTVFCVAILCREYSFRLLTNNNISSEQSQSESAKSLLDNNSFRVKYNDIVARLEKYYLNEEDIDPDKIIDGMCQGIVDSLGDKYADYYNTEEYAKFNEQTEGKYAGIGAYVSQNSITGAIVIVKPFEDSPAEKAGMKSGDIILEIDGTSVIDKTLDEAVSLMKGEAGTRIPVKLRRDKEVIDLTVERAVVDVPTVTHTMLKDYNIGYIYIAAFDAVTLEQFNEAIEDLDNKGAKGLVIDIRDNGGGRLDAVIPMLNRILSEGLIMYTETKNGRDQVYEADDKESYTKPVAVLINEYSASASEVFAGALQDHKVATIVGTKSYGKGVVQSLYTLNGAGDGSAIKFTTAKYYTPSGRNIDGIGIEPDVKVELDLKQTIKSDDGDIDNQLKKAIDIVKKQL